METASYADLVRLAMAQADVAIARGDPPFGAVLAAPEGAVLAVAANAQVSSGDPTAHAEIELIRVAAREIGIRTLERLTVATNAEPCSMCASALVKVRTATVAYGAVHERHMDPLIPLEEIVSRSARPFQVVHVESLMFHCRAQILRARRATPAPD